MALNPEEGRIEIRFLGYFNTSQSTMNQVILDVIARLTGNAVVRYEDFNTGYKHRFVQYHNEPEAHAFQFSVLTTTPSETFSLPLDASGRYDFVVNWGDGSSDLISSWTNTEKTHTYVNAGTHIISMAGTCTVFNFNNEGDKTKLIEVLDVVDMKFSKLSFYGCSNLTTVSANISCLASLTTADSMFRNCASLVSLPSGIFSNCHLITGFGFFCKGCTNLTSIPEGIFDTSVLATGFYVAFESSGITSIPVELFKYNVLMNNIDYAFQYCHGLTEIPVGMLDYNTQLTTVQGLFWETAISAIPANLFDNNTLITTFYGTFHSSSSVTSIPTDLFKYNTLATDFRKVFQSCGSITAIPADLFKYNVLATNFQDAFNGCGNIVTVPSYLFRYNVLATEFDWAFQGCVRAEYPADMFFAVGEEGTRFLNKVVKFDQCFTRTVWLGASAGVAPRLWACNYGTGHPSNWRVFYNAGNSLSSLANFNDIPNNWVL